MISRTELNLQSLPDAELQTQHYGHTVMKGHFLESLPTTEEGTVDITRLTQEAGDALISPITRFQRLINAQMRLEEIREELTRRGLEPRTPEEK